MPENNRKLRVFLCHASQDKPVVRELYRHLSVEGWIDPWLDEAKLFPGMDWPLEIEKALESTDVVIVCLSSNSVTKEGYVQKELKKILDIAEEKPDGTIFLVPLRLDDCSLPHRLKNWQYEDYFPSGKQFDSYKRILRSLMMRAESVGFDLAKISSLSELDIDGNDEMLKHAIIIAIDNETVTVALLQRKLHIGYTRSTRLIAKMEEMGVIKEMAGQEQSTWKYIVDRKND